MQYVERFPDASTYEERMLLDRLIHGIHVSGQPPARNLFEHYPRQVLAALDELGGQIAPSTNVPSNL